MTEQTSVGDHGDLKAVVFRCRRVLAATRDLEVLAGAGSENAGDVGGVLVHEFAVVEELGLNIDTTCQFGAPFSALDCCGTEGTGRSTLWTAKPINLTEELA